MPSKTPQGLLKELSIELSTAKAVIYTNSLINMLIAIGVFILDGTPFATRLKSLERYDSGSGASGEILSKQQICDHVWSDDFCASKDRGRRLLSS